MIAIYMIQYFCFTTVFIIACVYVYITVTIYSGIENESQRGESYGVQTHLLPIVKLLTSNDFNLTTQGQNSARNADVFMRGSHSADLREVGGSVKVPIRGDTILQRYSYKQDDKLHIYHVIETSNPNIAKKQRKRCTIFS